MFGLWWLKYKNGNPIEFRRKLEWLWLKKRTLDHLLWRHDDVIGGMTHLLSRPLSPSPSRTRNRAHLLSIPPAARSSPDGLRAHAFTHVVGRTIVSIRLSTPASQTTWSLRSFEVIQHATRSFEVRGHFTYHWTLFWTWNNSSRICSPIGTKNFDLVSFKLYCQKTILLKKKFETNLYLDVVS